MILTRFCSFSEVITLRLHDGLEGDYLAQFRNSMGFAQYHGKDLDCAKYENSPKDFDMSWRFDTRNENGNTDTFYFVIESDNVEAATHLDRKIVNPFENRKSLQFVVQPYLEEVHSFPWKFSQIEEIRILLATKNPSIEASPNSISGKAYFLLELNRADGTDVFDGYYLYLDPTDSSQDKLYLRNSMEVPIATGLDARISFYNYMKSSTGKILDYAGESSP